MTKTTKKDLMDVLQLAWDRGSINPRTGPGHLIEVAKVALDTEALQQEFNLAWFTENEAWLKSVLARKQTQRIEEAVQLLFDEVNRGNEKLLIDPLGRQHATLLDTFAWTVLQAINDHKRHRGNPPTPEELSEIRYATNLAITPSFTAKTGLSDDEMSSLVQEAVMAKRASFDGRIGRWLQEVVVKRFSPREN